MLDPMTSKRVGFIVLSEWNSITLGQSSWGQLEPMKCFQVVDEP